MKTYCKGVDICNVDFITGSILEFMKDKCKKKWAIRFYAQISDRTISYTKINLFSNSKFLIEISRIIAIKMHEHLIQETVRKHVEEWAYNEKVIRYVPIKDVGSGKERYLGLECTILKL